MDNGVPVCADEIRAIVPTELDILRSSQVVTTGGATEIRDGAAKGKGHRQEWG